MNIKNRKLTLGQLEQNPDNPKKPIGGKYDSGLTESLKRFEGLEMFVVRPSPLDDGKFQIGNGNTRYKRLLDMHGPKHKVDCKVIEGLSDSEWTLLCLTYDRHKAEFDEAKVTEQSHRLEMQARDEEERKLIKSLTLAYDPPPEIEEDDPVPLEELEYDINNTVNVWFEMTPEGRDMIDGIITKKRKGLERSKKLKRIIDAYDIDEFDDGMIVEMATRMFSLRQAK